MVTPIWETIIDSKQRSFDFARHYYDSVDSRPSIGMLSTVPLGMQRNIPFDSFKYTPNSSTTQLPDWLLLDLLAPTIRPYSHMNSAMGKVNLNAQLVGGGNAWQTASRWRPLQSVFQNMEPNTTVSSNSPTPSSIVGNIINHTSAVGGLSVAETGGSGYPPVYDYVGELCDINGVVGATTPSGPTDNAGEWAAEGLIRNVANLVTTKSNTFTVWGIAESVQKSPSNTNYGVFESGDTIQSTKRFSSTIERYVWPGVDGVPGNGAINSANGTYLNAAQGTDNGGSGTNPAGAANSYFWGLPQVGLLPWMPLPVPPETEGNGSQAKWLSGSQWPVLDGPDTPTFPNLANKNRYDYGYRSWSSASSPDYFNFRTMGSHNVWGNDDPTANWKQTALDNANNPIRAWMKYRTFDFHYIDQ